MYATERYVTLQQDLHHELYTRVMMWIQKNASLSFRVVAFFPLNITSVDTKI